MTNAISAANFKSVFKPGDLRNQANVKAPVLDNISIEEFLGADFKYPMNLSMPTGAHPTKDGSRLWADTGVMDRWTVTDVAKQYRTLTFDYETMARSRRDIGAYIDAKVREMQDALNQFKTQLAIAFFKGKAGDLGQLVGSTPVAWVAGVSQTFTLRNPDDAKNFHRGQYVDLFSTRSVGGVQRGNTPATQAWQVTSSDLVRGQIGLKISTGTMPTTTEMINNGSVVGGAGDFLFQKGCRNQYANGLPELIPMDTANPTDDSAAVATALYGVTRSLDPQRTAGYRIDWKGSFLETINETAMVAAVNGYIDPYTMYWLSPRSFKAFLQEAANLSQPPQIDAGYTAVLGVKVVKVVTPYGEIRVSYDPYMVNDKMYMIDMSAIKILAIDGVLIKLIDEDGLTQVRLQSDDAFEMQYRSMYQCICLSPGRCAVNNIPTLS